MIANANLIAQLAIQIKNGIIKTCQCECKSYHIFKKDYNWNTSTCVCENSKYLKSIFHTSVIKCDETLTVMDIVSKKRQLP